jgi:hypothetical protein
MDKCGVVSSGISFPIFLSEIGKHILQLRVRMGGRDIGGVRRQDKGGL